MVCKRTEQHGNDHRRLPGTTCGGQRHNHGFCQRIPQQDTHGHTRTKRHQPCRRLGGWSVEGVQSRKRAKILGRGLLLCRDAQPPAQRARGRHSMQLGRLIRGGVDSRRSRRGFPRNRRQLQGRARGSRPQRVEAVQRHGESAAQLHHSRLFVEPGREQRFFRLVQILRHSLLCHASSVAQRLRPGRPAHVLRGDSGLALRWQQLANGSVWPRGAMERCRHDRQLRDGERH